MSGLSQRLDREEETGGATWLLWQRKEPWTTLTSPVLLATQVQKIRPILPASTFTGVLRPGSSALLCPQVQVQHASGNRPCSNNSSNFKGLRSKAWWIPEAQGKFLKACSSKSYKSSVGTDILPNLLIKAKRPSYLFLQHHLKNGTTLLLIPETFQWDSSF